MHISDKVKKENKLYCCETKDCRFLFESDKIPECCPDCGKKRIRLANSQEIVEYVQRKKEFNNSL